MVALLDTHQHLVYPEINRYSWTDNSPALADKSFTIQDYQQLTDDVEIVGTLFMETGVDDKDYQTETRAVARLSEDKSNNILGLIASCRPEQDDGFSAWLDECAELNVVGFRRILHVVDDALSTPETFRRNVRAIGDRGKVFDMCFHARQLPLAVELAQACPNTQFVLNHCGVPDIAGGELQGWQAGMRAIAREPNIVCKLSGIMAYCSPGQASLAAIQPYVDHVLDTFGAGRIIWGSDWPVVDVANGLPAWISVTQQILEQLSPDEAARIGATNAAQIYRVATSA